MAANTAPVFPLIPYAAVANLSVVTACTTRGPTVTAGLAAANILPFVPASSTNGRKIDTIRAKASSSSMTAPTAQQLVGLWLHDGTTAYLWEELVVNLITPSTTSSAYEGELIGLGLVLPAAWAIYVSTTITTTAATTAFTVQAFGGDF